MGNFIGGFILGIFVGGVLMHSVEIIRVEDVYQEGRQSVLERKVTVGGDTTGVCAVEIPLGVLADMVNSGVMTWHDHCKKETGQ